MKKSEAQGFGFAMLIGIVLSPFFWAYSQWGWWGIGCLVICLVLIFWLWVSWDNRRLVKRVDQVVTGYGSPDETVKCTNINPNREAPLPYQSGQKNPYKNTTSVSKDDFSEQMIYLLMGHKNLDIITMNLPHYMNEQAQFQIGVEHFARQVCYILSSRSAEAVDDALGFFEQQMSAFDMSQLNQEARDFFIQFSVAVHHVAKVARVINPAANHLREAVKLKTESGKRKRVGKAIECVLTGLAVYPSEQAFIQARQLIEAIDISEVSLLSAAEELKVELELAR